MMYADLDDYTLTNTNVVNYPPNKQGLDVSKH